MGFGFSKPLVSGLSGTSGVSREQLLKSASNNREFVDNLFKAMIQHLTPEDFLKLSRTQTCNNYIFMMADSIQGIFEKLPIRPRQEKDSGIVYFQKIDKLRTPPDESRQLCLIIAYYYIRIFQLFGALALTIIDDPSAGQVLGIIRYAAPRQPAPQEQSRGLFGFARPQPPPGYRAAPFRNPLRGGSKEDFREFSATKNIVPLHTLFENVEYDERRRPYFEFRDRVLKNYVFLPKENLNLYIQINDSNLLQCRIQFTPKTSRGYESDSYSVRLDKFFYESEDREDLDDRINTTLKSIKPIEFLIRFSTSQQRWVLESRSSSSYETFESSLAKTTNKILDIVKKIVRNPDRDEYDEYDRVTRPGRISSFDRSDPLGRTRERQTSEIGVTKTLQNEYIINTLKSLSQNKTVSFCIARAFQLLDANTTFNPRAAQSGTSGVCAKFDAFSSSQRKEVYSVPQQGDSLAKVPGLRALDQLYYTKPSLDQKEGYKVGLDNPNEYLDFLKKMTEMFGSSSSSRAQSLDKISAKSPSCAREAIGHYLQISDQNGINSIMKYVSELFGRQLNHTKRVIQFLQTRLVVIKNNQVSIHPRLLKGGIDELALLSKEVRNLLVDYYSGCEAIYQKGVKAVLDAKHVAVGR